MTILCACILVILPCVGMIPAHMAAGAAPVETEQYDYR